ncbi:hypothetical protein TanjilG_21862 [Lupinus angustifolius]|uniref:Prolyl endopeptidase n=1 Tax=Lupinus angustifolius TaxID=3871 RepID=A0A1J7HIK9_LUPAN|nr:hypothetical protein TanjilG_21862 [Lupinus angustifolius]
MAFRTLAVLRHSTTSLTKSCRTIPSSFFSSSCHRFTLPPEAPPSPKKIPFTVSVHRKTWQDPYHWMSNTNDPHLLDHLHRENTYADAFMADTLKMQSTLSSEMKSRIPATISTPPERWGSWLYYQYIPEGKEFPVLCRKLETGGTVIVDNIISIAGYVHVGTCRVSPDHNYLAYTLDISGGERVLCRKLGSDYVNDFPVFTESDSSFCVDITSTKDGKFITVYIIDSANPMDGLQRICKRTSAVQYFVEHHSGLFYILTNAPMPDDGQWFGEDYYLVRCRVEDIESAKWENTILPDNDMSICDMDIFNGHLVLSLNKKGLPLLCSVDFPIQIDSKQQIYIQDLKPWYFPMPSNACNVVPGSNHDFLNDVYRVVLSSPVMPDVIVDYDMSRQTYSIVHQEEVICDSVRQSCTEIFEQSTVETQEAPSSDKIECSTNSGSQLWNEFSQVFCCQREEVISHDGVRVPLTIVYSRESWQKGLSPGLLVGYGAYGEDLDKSWCSDRLSLLERGWVVAFADVRGGGLGDSSWHKSGSGLNKHNSIFDFVSCGNYLVNEGYVQSDQLGAIGWSAGGFLIGAAMNMSPQLFRAAILKVPFLDVCNTLLDPSLPLTILDYEEFGNPQIQSNFDSIFSYSPYDNIPQGSCFPSVLVTAAVNDSRQPYSCSSSSRCMVGVWEGAKWVAKVRDSTCSNCSRAVIMKTSMIGGHFGEGGHYGQCDETAYEYAFLMKAFGISKE